MVYLTHYQEYPIYEPAEGGYYYYAGIEAFEYYRLASEKQAKRKLAKMKAELEEEGFIIYDDKAILPGEYIGEGERWVIERKYGSHNQGKQIYQ